MPETSKQKESFNYIRLQLLISKLGMQTLRLLFRGRYKALTSMDWENGSVSINKDFINDQATNCNFSSEQKGAFKSADVNKWDLAMLTTILLTMGQRSSKQKDAEKAAEDEAVKVLRSIRNYVEHVPGHAISNGEYEEKWGKAKHALLLLGAREKEIEHYRTSSKLEGVEFKTAVVDEENEGKSKELRSRAKKLIAAGELEKGLQLYAEALLLIGLSTKEKSCLHADRSLALLTRLEDQVDDALPYDVVQHYTKVTMEDAKQVIQLQPQFWRGYFLEGKCFQAQKLLAEAVDSFETALSFSPGSEEILNARSECRMDQFDIDANVFQDPLFAPRVFSEVVQTQAEERHKEKAHKGVGPGFKAIAQILMSSSDPAIRAMGCVLMGHRYLVGDEVPLDKKKATELFREAAEAGSPEGTENLAINYLRGTGVKRNIPEAVRLFELAAKQPLKEGDKNRSNNEAISRAKGALGLLYQRGIGKPRNYITAAEWFTRAALEGFFIATCNLASMYFIGQGIPRDPKLALQYQRLAVEQGGGAVAMHILGNLLAQVGDTTKALYWSDRAIALGYTVAILGRGTLESMVAQWNRKLEKFKKKLPQHVLNSDVPIHILFDRYSKRNSPEWTKLVKLSMDVRNAHPNSIFCESDRTGYAFDLIELHVSAAMGRQYARILIDTLVEVETALEYLKLFLTLDCITKEPLHPWEEGLKKLALAHFALCYTREDFAVSLPQDCKGKLMEISLEFMNDQERSDSDLHARVCYVSLLNKSFEEAIKFAKVCKSMYPKEPHFHVMHANMLGFLGRHAEGVNVAEKGLELFPGNWDLLFARAGHLRLSWQPVVKDEVRTALIEDCQTFLSDEGGESAGEEMIQRILSGFGYKFDLQIEAYQEFINNAPSGHRKIPDAFYCIANLYCSEGRLQEGKSYYFRGLDAEQEQLSTFLPYTSNSKKIAQQLLKVAKKNKERSDFDCRYQEFFDRLLEEDPEEKEENRKLKLTSPKRTVTVRDCRSRFTSWEASKESMTDFEEKHKHLQTFYMFNPTTAEGKHTQRAPSRSAIKSLKDIRFEDMDPTLDKVYNGRVINLTIMEEYIDGIMNSIHTVVKDESDDFSIICFYGFDRRDPSTKTKLGFGSRIRLMNPYMRLPIRGGPVIRVDDPKSVVFRSSGYENPICRYCWKPNPGPRCSKCKTALYCNKECQQLDWVVLGHKDLCETLFKRRNDDLWKIILDSCVTYN